VAHRCRLQLLLLLLLVVVIVPSLQYVLLPI
jgi:hypothetical protein